MLLSIHLNHEAADAWQRGMFVCKQQGIPTDDPMWLAFEGTKVHICRDTILCNSPQPEYLLIGVILADTRLTGLSRHPCGWPSREPR